MSYVTRLSNEWINTHVIWWMVFVTLMHGRVYL